MLGGWGPLSEDAIWAQIENDLYRFDGNGWRLIERPAGKLEGAAFGGPDGTLWFVPRGTGTSSRYSASGWAQFGEDLATRRHEFGLPGDDATATEVAPDGSLWFALAVDGEGPIHARPGAGCDGLARFDGDTHTHFLAGQCVYDVDVARDGTAWLLAGRWTGSPLDDEPQVGPVQLYVITPEAVAAGE